MNSIALAMSFGSAILESGIRASLAFLITGSAYIFADIGVCVMPGETTLTRISVWRPLQGERLCKHRERGFGRAIRARPLVRHLPRHRRREAGCATTFF